MTNRSGGETASKVLRVSLRYVTSEEADSCRTINVITGNANYRVKGKSRFQGEVGDESRDRPSSSSSELRKRGKAPNCAVGFCSLALRGI